MPRLIGKPIAVSARFQKGLNSLGLNTGYELVQLGQGNKSNSDHQRCTQGSLDKIGMLLGFDFNTRELKENIEILFILPVKDENLDLMLMKVSPKATKELNKNLEADGFPALVFSDDDILKLASPYQFTLVGKFSLKHPNQDSIRSFFGDMK
ncbi:hypothetical protein IEQ34_006823 [Dendrobium chrysotoxum]|uniref:Uncharacterized protein n=1 Tax=Dendrobium chrysotoxum TaxID=161865 RepID=A0AAV7H556_DENCH|nr:hypothetical protein IEQ34_006823 [Dendrobium chrysotoxum]